MSTLTIAPAPEEPHRPRVVLEGPTKCFRPIPGNRIITLDSVTDLLRSMKSEGQLVPGQCCADPERPEGWIIVAGNRRWFCADLLGLPFKFLPIEGDTSPRRVLKIAITDNAIRKNLSLLELADQIKEYATLTGITCQALLARELELAESEICRARLLPKKLNPKLHEHVRSFEIGRSWAELIASLPTDELQEKAAAHYFSFKPDKPKRDAFKNYIETLKPGVRKPREKRSTRSKTAGGLGFSFSGTPDVMLAETKKVVKALETLIANKWDLSLLGSVVRS